jgi:cellulose synthase/poly-beta-1,6-N-acetylglucosamine synthase-like glycosyltransferase
MGGYSYDTAAEDAEMAIRCHKFGFLVLQDLTATVVTEVPLTIRALKSQWKRWVFGIYQAIYKHRDVLVHSRYGMLMPVMWYAALSTIIPTVVLPFMYFRFGQAVVAGNWRMVVIYPLVFTCYRFMMCVFAMVVLREWSWNPFTAVYYRFINDPLQIYLTYATWYAIITGKIIGWNGTRVQRQGAEPAATRTLATEEAATEPASA